MKKFAVGHIDWFDNNLIIEIVEAEDWRSALLKHSKIDSSWASDYFGKTLEDAKANAFDSDMMIDVIEIK